VFRLIWWNGSRCYHDAVLKEEAADDGGGIKSGTLNCMFFVGLHLPESLRKMDYKTQGLAALSSLLPVADSWGVHLLSVGAPSSWLSRCKRLPFADVTVHAACRTCRS